ncbi:MAG: hypothetical protein ACRDNM_04670 [Gaiellaceae bacterium]
MVGKHYLFKLFVAIAVAASIAVVGARTAKAGNGSSRSVASARHLARTQGLPFITDTLAGNSRLPSIGRGGRAEVA